ncbi:hypothetical protein [Actinospongicola halichondriae]|uniref:hypothetical protein n=1 Tax=Actinospongicola halichondriae TaxID=3236844 RepID=UPI003D3BC814
MRQLARGVLATLVLLMSACGTDNGSAAPATAAARPVVDTALASASKISTPNDVVATSTGSFTIAVTSPEGIASPGLDAAVSVLAGRPDTNLVVTAPAADVRDTADARATTALAPVETETMTGHVAAAVNGGMLDAVETVTAPGAARPDLVVIGLTDDAATGSAAAAGATLAVERGIPVLIVVVGGDDPDLAGAAMLLSTITDYELDLLVAEPTVHVLTVPACEAGSVRGPVQVDAAEIDEPTPTVDCTSPDTGPFDDETEAWAAGHATLADWGQLIP